MARTKKIVYNADGTLKDLTVCDLCGTKVARKGDIPRHMRRHLSAEEKSSQSYACPYDGCTYKNLQKGNVDTHIRTHTKEKKKCPSCNFETPDPGSLTRHRKRHHGYVPEPRKRRNPGNGPPAQLTQPHIMIEAPSTYSRSASTSTELSSSSSVPASQPTGTDQESDTAQSIVSSPYSHGLVLPDSNVEYNSDSTQSAATSLYFSHGQPLASVGHVMQSITHSASTFIPPLPMIAPETQNLLEPSRPPLLRRAPLDLRDILSDEGHVYWGRRL
ncbi:hypothetical protein J3R30DRAFT_3406134 [Lentinula aciculospora]|uniref:C2H2-type domain-containing protein n=1 Tax=Lentinula aciculospora TaxID=153920 RepID=A0A9W9A5K1_9AGAR|nr:hypothetical protein J3R30DRAFT_3406134 [Lentinula aciculospora]